MALRQYVEALFEQKDKALDAALASQKEAVAKAEVATDRIALRAQADQHALREETSERLGALRRELEAATLAQKEAVLKQEQATERRFDGVNEWRDQSADRERSSAEERAKLQASFMLKEVAENQFVQLRVTSDGRFDVLRDQITALGSRMDTFGGVDQGQTRARAEFNVTRTFVISVAGAMIALLAIAVTIIVALHG